VHGKTDATLGTYAGCVSSNTPGAGAVRRGSHRVAILVLGLAGVSVWMLMMQAAAQTWHVEPTDAAIAAAAAARPVAVTWAVVLMVWAVMLARATHRRVVGVLGASPAWWSLCCCSAAAAATVEPSSSGWRPAS
jgi:hypothetical protein